ncbi:hypothetical protein B7463_g10897, partial [Scytalidium lignicola]
MASTSDLSTQQSRIKTAFTELKKKFRYKLEDGIQFSPLLPSDEDSNYGYKETCATALDDLKPKWGPDAFKSYPLSSPRSIFRQDPSEEVDAAWERATDINAIIISSDDVRRLGKDPSTAVKAPESWGYGSDAYIAQLDGIHLVHCLNILRKSLYHNYEKYFPNGSSISYHFHVSHCQEILAHHLMCQPSVELITYNWVEHMLPPYPDYDITKQCWDYDQLLKWKDENRVMRVNDERWMLLSRPKDAKAVPLPVTIVEEYHITNPESNIEPRVEEIR